MARDSAEIQLDLDAAYAARRAALTGGESYKLDTGHGSQSVTRNLKNIESVIKSLEAEMADATDPSGGVLAPTFRRHPGYATGDDCARYPG